MTRIAVVGAGISGLSAAWYLQREFPSARVEVFEANDRVGGVIQTLAPPHLADPYLIECGADNFATLIPDAMDLVHEMGLASEFIAPQSEYRIAQVVCRGKLIPIPNGFSLMQPTRMGAILTTPILSLRGRLRVLAEYFIPSRKGDDDESVESFAVRRLGRECFERLVEPIVGGIFTAKAETLSMQSAMPQFVAMERQYGGLIRAAFAKRKLASKEQRSARAASGARYDQFLAPKQGMSWWLKQLAAPVSERLHFRAYVRGIEKLNNGWELRIESADRGQQNSLQFDAVCLALPSNRSAALLQSVHPELANELMEIPYASSAVAVLAVRRSEIRPDAFCFGSIAPAIENRDCLAISLSSEKYAGRCPSDTVLARVFMGGAIRPEILERSDDDLLAIARREVQKLFGPSTSPIYEHLVRWPQAMPQYLVGHRHRIAKIRRLVEQHRGLEVIGNAYDGVGIPQCVRGAKQASKRLLAQLTKPIE